MDETYIVIRVPTTDSWEEATLIRGRVAAHLYTPFRDEDINRCERIGLSFKVSEEYPNTVVACKKNYEVVRRFNINKEQA